MKDLNIVIAHRGNALGLWATIHSCETDLADSGFDYSYLISVNGEVEKENPDLYNILHFVKKAGRLGHVEYSEQPLAPPTARQRVTKHADGKYLFFFDNHCLVAKGYFKRAIFDMVTYGMDMLHPTTKFFMGDPLHYHYRLTLEKNFWAQSSLITNCEHKPYRIACAGHGAFVVPRAVWEEVGGYWEGFSGYGGEETYFDLKMALLDKTNWLDPKLVHYHFAGARGYSRHYTDDFYRNMLMCANIIGGYGWTERVAQNFAVNFPKNGTDKTLLDLMGEALVQSKDEAVRMASIRKRTLEEQLAQFGANNIAY